MLNIRSERLKLLIGSVLLCAILLSVESGAEPQQDSLVSGTRNIGLSENRILTSTAPSSPQALTDDLRLMQEHPEDFWFPLPISIQRMSDPDERMCGAIFNLFCQACKKQIAYKMPNSLPFSLIDELVKRVGSTSKFLENLPTKVTMDLSCLCLTCANGRPPAIIFTTACAGCNETFTWQVNDFPGVYKLKFLEISFPIAHLDDSNIDEFEKKREKLGRDALSIGYYPSANHLGDENVAKASAYLVSKYFCAKCQKNFQLKAAPND